MMIRYLLIFIASFLVYTSSAQSLFVPKDEAIEEMLSYLSENDEQDIDFEEFASRLSFLYDNPINLNSCTVEELDKLSLFSAIQIMNIIAYRKYDNSYVNLIELKLIEGISKEQIFLALPFLKTTEIEKYSPKINLKNLSKMGKHSIRIRYQRVLEDQAAYIPDENGETKYLGSQDRIYSKYKFQFTDKIQAGFTADKDAGEPFFKDPNAQGFDFYSGFVQYKSKGLIKTLVLGDYSLQFGQGLALWNGFGTGKSTLVTGVTKFGKGVRKYSSTDENNFFRGAATTLSYKNFELSVFYSNKKIDGSVDSDTLDNDIDRFTSFDKTGYHATESQFEKKGSIAEMVYGTDLSYKFKRLKIGATFVKHEYSHSLAVSDKLYKIYDFHGNANHNGSFHYKWNMNQIFFSGEVAVDRNLNMAVTNNATFNISSKLGFAILHRYFDKKYQAIYSQAFSEGTRVQNEQGFYTGINFFPTKNWTVKAYVDLYEFPWMRYQISTPSAGLDYFVLAEYALSSNFNFYLRFKDETRLKDISSDHEFLKTQEDVNLKKFRIHFNYGDRGRFHFKTRMELSWFEHQDKEQGFLAYQDVIYNWKKFPLKSTLRFLVFDTEGYNSRIYTFENDLLYNYAIPAFSDRGMKFYILFKYKIIKNLTVWAKYGLTYYLDKESLGSGYTESQGNKRSEIKLQLRWKF